MDAIFWHNPFWSVLWIQLCVYGLVPAGIAVWNKTASWHKGREFGSSSEAMIYWSAALVVTTMSNILSSELFQMSTPFYIIGLELLTIVMLVTKGFETIKRNKPVVNGFCQGDAFSAHAGHSL